VGRRHVREFEVLGYSRSSSSTLRRGGSGDPRRWVPRPVLTDQRQGRPHSCRLRLRPPRGCSRVKLAGRRFFAVVSEGPPPRSSRGVGAGWEEARLHPCRHTWKRPKVASTGDEAHQDPQGALFTARLARHLRGCEHLPHPATAGKTPRDRTRPEVVTFISSGGQPRCLRFRRAGSPT